jgi:plasmid stabilization system protein ParE
MAEMTVMWAPSALDDVESIAEYIAKDSVEIASVFVIKHI